MLLHQALMAKPNAILIKAKHSVSRGREAHCSTNIQLILRTVQLLSNTKSNLPKFLELHHTRTCVSRELRVTQEQSI